MNEEEAQIRAGEGLLGNEIDFSELNETEASEARRSINPVDLENLSHKQIQAVYQEMLRQMQHLKCRALIEADKYAIAEKESRSDPDARTSVRCRVRLTNSNTLEIAWYRLKAFRLPDNAAVVRGKTYQRKVDGETKTYMIKGDHLKKGRFHRYASSKFKDEPTWARQIISENEEKNEILRKQSEIITEIRRLLCKYDRLTTEFYDDKVLSDYDCQRIRPITLRGDKEEEGGQR